jgi:hypothetical protein
VEKIELITGHIKGGATVIHGGKMKKNGTVHGKITSHENGRK